MRLRIVSFFLLIIFRVFLVPAWYAWHIQEVKDASATFEHIRLKKRRSSQLEEHCFTAGVCMTRVAVAPRIQRLLPFCPIDMDAPVFIRGKDRLLHFISSQSGLPLYLRNRTLRI